MHDALTDLHAYVLALDAERQRLGEHAEELTRRATQDGVELARRRSEISEELDAMRAMVATLRNCADPGGDKL
jgi:hypothetical protein